jgi:hypothetical protein
LVQDGVGRILVSQVARSEPLVPDYGCHFLSQQTGPYYSPHLHCFQVGRKVLVAI